MSGYVVGQDIYPLSCYRLHANHHCAGLNGPGGLMCPLRLLPEAQLLLGHGLSGPEQLLHAGMPDKHPTSPWESQTDMYLLQALLNFTLFVYGSFFYGVTRLCYGRLRAVETEQLTERAWFAITETCLAMTIFREEIGAWFIVMFTALVTGKVWGWIGDGRVEVLEQQPPANPRLFHTRLSLSLALSILYDIWIFQYALNTVIQQARPNMMVMFAFEFAVLLTTSARSGTRYLLTLSEQHIIRKQTRKRLEERRREVRTERERLTREREAAAATGEPTPENQEPLPDENDIDEMDIEVPGWAAKGEMVLWLDLVTGKFHSLRGC